MEQTLFSKNKSLQFCAVWPQPCNIGPKQRSAGMVWKDWFLMQLCVILPISLKAFQDSTYLFSNGPARDLVRSIEHWAFRNATQGQTPIWLLNFEPLRLFVLIVGWLITMHSGIYFLNFDCGAGLLTFKRNWYVDELFLYFRFCLWMSLRCFMLPNHSTVNQVLHTIFV